MALPPSRESVFDLRERARAATVAGGSMAHAIPSDVIAEAAARSDAFDEFEQLGAHLGTEQMNALNHFISLMIPGDGSVAEPLWSSARRALQGVFREVARCVVLELAALRRGKP